MPLLNRKTVPHSWARELGSNRVGDDSSRRDEGTAGRSSALFETCANPGCLSGWLHLWRSRSAALFEGGWSCSPGCTEARMAAAVRRELDGRGGAAAPHRHRVPLGLLMMEKGWITPGQLRQALDMQRSAGAGRLGHWLVTRVGVSEQLMTRALSLQWSCPVLSLEFHHAEALTPVLPRLFVDAFGALPLRIAAGKLLYLGFEDRLDPVLALAMERMTGLRIESGLVQGSDFRPAHAAMLKAVFPPWNCWRPFPSPCWSRPWRRQWNEAGRWNPGWSGCTIFCGCACGESRRPARSRRWMRSRT